MLKCFALCICVINLIACGSGSETPAANSSPVITLNGDNPHIVAFKGSYVESGASATDPEDGTVAVSIESSSVNTAQAGASFNVSYNAIDSDLNETAVTRVVQIAENQAPSMTLNTPVDITISLGDDISALDPGVTATDPEDGLLAAESDYSALDNNTAGTYNITYTAQDAEGQQVSVQRSVVVSLASSINADLVASRTSGPAPLAVFFDATGTIDNSLPAIDPFRQLGYYFDFDDTDSGDWAHSGLSKNSETGAPLAAHVFDQPGSYRVGVRARNVSGGVDDVWVDITVQDPDVVYAGLNTVVITTGTDFSDAPLGAQQISNVTAWPDFESNKRYLLKRGDDFTALGMLLIRDCSDFQLASFGVGDKPIISRLWIDQHSNNAATPPVNAVIQGLRMGDLEQSKMFNHLLIYQNEVIGDGARIVFAAANQYFATNSRGTSLPSDWKHPGPVFVVENHVDMQGYPAGALNGISGLAHHIALLGNHSERAKEHSVRIFGTYKSVIAHNLLSGPATDGLRTDLKLMANGINDWPADHSLFLANTETEVLPNTRYVKISNNIIGRTDGPHVWHIQVAPQDNGSSSTVEGLRDVIVENNEFINSTRDDGLERGLQTLGIDITERGNQFPAEWTQPVQTTSFPSGYSDYSVLYNDWHGPYFIDDAVPGVEAPLR